MQGPFQLGEANGPREKMLATGGGGVSGLLALPLGGLIDDREFRVVELAPQIADHAPTGQIDNAVVEEHQIGSRHLAQFGDRAGDIDAEAELGQQQLRLFAGAFGRIDDECGAAGERAERESGGFDVLQLGGEPETTSLPGFAGDADLPIHQFGKAARDGET